jgi:hypothetical protein
MTTDALRKLAVGDSVMVHLERNQWHPGEVWREYAVMRRTPKQIVIGSNGTEHFRVNAEDGRILGERGRLYEATDERREENRLGELRRKVYYDRSKFDKLDCHNLTEAECTLILGTLESVKHRMKA